MSLVDNDMSMIYFLFFFFLKGGASKGGRVAFDYTEGFVPNGICEGSREVQLGECGYQLSRHVCIEDGSFYVCGCLYKVCSV